MPSNVAGYLAPESTPAVLEDGALLAFLHGVLVGITGLAADLVRRGWQLVPAPDPSPEATWLAYAVTGSRPDHDPVVSQSPEAPNSLVTETAAVLRRHEELDVLVTVYGPAAQATVGRLRDGLYIEQNRAALRAAGVGLGGVSDPVHAPEQVGTRWFDRWDVTLTLRREIVREYPVLHFLRSLGEIDGSRGGDATVQAVFDTEGEAP